MSCTNMDDLSGAHMDTSKDDIDMHSDDSLETTFSSTSERSNMISGQDTPEAETEAETPATIKKRRYPYAPLFFIMAATIGQR